jgi:hypothetical protein
MATIQRPTKEGSVRTYQEKVGLGFVDILASEMDADLDTIYAAWNGGADAVNIKDGSITYAKLAPDAQLWRDTGSTLTPGTNFTSRPVVIPGSGLTVGGAGAPNIHLGQRFRIESYDGFLNSLWINDVSSIGYNVGQAGWALRFNYSGSDYTQLFYRAPGTTTNVEKLQINSTGDLTVPGLITATVVGGAAGMFRGVSSAGTLAAPTPSLQYHGLAKVAALGCYQAGSFAEQGALYFYADENWSTFAHGVSAQIRVTPSGTTAMNDFNFFNNGSFTIFGSSGQKATGTTWSNPSDIRIKKNVVPYDAGLKELLALQPVQFEHNGFADTEDGRMCWGYLADDVAAVMPECVSTETKRLRDESMIDLQVLDTSNISLAVVNAIKELAARVAMLEGASA